MDTLPDHIKVKDTFNDFKRQLNMWEGPQCSCTYCNMCVNAYMNQFAFYLLNMYCSQIVPLYLI